MNYAAILILVTFFFAFVSTLMMLYFIDFVFYYLLRYRLSKWEHKSNLYTAMVVAVFVYIVTLTHSLVS